MTSDPDLEAKTRFSPRSILDDSFLGEGVALWRGGSGFLPRLPRRWVGGGGKGKWGGLLPVPSHLPFQGKGLKTLVFTGQTLGPGTFPMISLVPGPACPVPASCRRPSRCDRQGPILKSPSESDTLPRLVRRRFAAGFPEQCVLSKACARSSLFLSRCSAGGTLTSST